ncbi:hypothetical protein QJS10_CPB15g00031 [Acorus calamus]|uniref:Uncharacterized protein n=1 Tax=Acorus calamus TaxID=4465 RepID=A0AAV9D808_ACOCL|nr:hypothetical protein QJS10_CPB15g00031 [Acorus calamus]
MIILLEVEPIYVVDKNLLDHFNTVFLGPNEPEFTATLKTAAGNHPQMKGQKRASFVWNIIVRRLIRIGGTALARKQTPSANLWWRSSDDGTLEPRSWTSSSEEEALRRRWRSRVVGKAEAGAGVEPEQGICIESDRIHFVCTHFKSYHYLNTLAFIKRGTFFASRDRSKSLNGVHQHKMEGKCFVEIARSNPMSQTLDQLQQALTQQPLLSGQCALLEATPA